MSTRPTATNGSSGHQSTTGGFSTFETADTQQKSTTSPLLQPPSDPRQVAANTSSLAHPLFRGLDSSSTGGVVHSHALEDLDTLASRTRKVQKDVYLSKTGKNRLSGNIKKLKASIGGYRTDVCMLQKTCDLSFAVKQLTG